MDGSGAERLSGEKKHPRIRGTMLIICAFDVAASAPGQTAPNDNLHL